MFEFVLRHFYLKIDTFNGNTLIIIIRYKTVIRMTKIWLAQQQKVSSSDTFYYAGVCINDFSKMTF